MEALACRLRIDNSAPSQYEPSATVVPAPSAVELFRQSLFWFASFGAPLATSTPYSPISPPRSPSTLVCTSLSSSLSWFSVIDPNLGKYGVQFSQFWVLPKLCLGLV